MNYIKNRFTTRLSIIQLPIKRQLNSAKKFENIIANKERYILRNIMETTNITEDTPKIIRRRPKIGVMPQEELTEGCQGLKETSQGLKDTEENIMTINGYDWSSIINDICKKSKKETKSEKDIHSFNSLVDRNLSQSENIRLGNYMEHIFNKFIEDNCPDWEWIGEKSKKGETQKDHIWLNPKTNTIIYAEQKNNVTLDSEKTKATVNKIKKVHQELSEKYPEYTVKSYLLAARYLSSQEPLCKQVTTTKFQGINVVGVNDYINLFNIEKIHDTVLFNSYDDYKELINGFCNAIF